MRCIFIWIFWENLKEILVAFYSLFNISMKQNKHAKMQIHFSWTWIQILRIYCNVSAIIVSVLFRFWNRLVFTDSWFSLEKCNEAKQKCTEQHKTPHNWFVSKLLSQWNVARNKNTQKRKIDSPHKMCVSRTVTCKTLCCSTCHLRLGTETTFFWNL